MNAKDFHSHERIAFFDCYSYNQSWYETQELAESKEVGQSLRRTGIRKNLTLLVLLIALFSTTGHAYAHIPCMCNNPSDQCTCFIQLGDKGLAVERIIECLKNKGYLDQPAKKKEFTLDVKQAVVQFQSDNNLECTGRMDDETLNALLRDILPDESSTHSALYWDGIYYVPTDGGIRYHSDPTCCGMYNPRLISGVNAESLGLKHCGWDTCVQYPPLTYSTLGLTPRKLPASYYAEEEKRTSTAIQRSIPSEDVESEYVGNKKSYVFHRGTCKFVKKMSQKNKTGLSTREEAIEKGYKPCSNCNP